MQTPKLINARSHSGLAGERIKKVLMDPDNVFTGNNAGNLLGTYTKKNLKAIPAVSIGDPPSGWAVSGLEMIVHLLPIVGESEHRNAAKGVDGQVSIEGSWKVDLRQHYIDGDDEFDEIDQHKGVTIDMAWDRIVSLTPCQWEFMARGDISTSYSQLSFLIPVKLYGRTIGSAPY